MRDFYHRIRKISLQAALFAALLAAPAIAQDIDSNLVGHWKLNETSGTTATDSSGGGFNGTMTNGLNGANDSVNGKINDALDFDGNDYIDMGNIGIVTAQPASSICLWYDYRGVDPLIEREMLIAEWQSGFHGWFLMLDNGAQTIAFTPSTLFGSTINTGANTITSNEWTHVCATFQGNTFTRLYINGVMITEDTTGIPATMHNGSLPLRIASQQFGNQFNGRLDDVRIYDRALTHEDVLALANSFPEALTCDAAHEAVMLYNNAERIMQYCNGTDWISVGAKGREGPPLAGLIAYWPLNDTSGANIADVAGNNYAGTWIDGSGNDVADDTVAGRVGNALDFNGTTDRIMIPTTAPGGPFDIDQFTLSAWVQLSALASAEVRRIMMRRDGSYGIFKKADDRLAVLASTTDDGGASLQAETPNPLTTGDLNKWLHVVGTYDGVTLRLYIDGTEVDNVPQTGLVNDTPTAFFAIGQNSDGTAGSRWPGLIDEAYIYDRALSSTEVAQLYQAGGGTQGIANNCTSPDGIGGEVSYNFTEGIMQYCNGTAWINMGPKVAGAGSAAITYTEPTGNLTGHWALDETAGTTATDSSASGNDGTVNGTDFTAGSIAGISNTALNFDGGDDFVDTNYNTDFASGGFSISAWAKTSSNGISRILSKYSAGGNQKWLLFNAGQIEFGITGSTGGITTAGTYNDDQWHLFTATTDATNMYLYIDGILDSVSTHDNTFTSNAINWHIGQRNDGAEYFNGQIDDVRIYDTTLSAEDVYSLYRSTGGTNTGLALHLPFDEIAGTTAADLSGNALDGTLQNGLDATNDSLAGITGRALDFDGGDDAVHAGNDPLINDSGAFTYSGWFYPTILSFNRRLFENGYSILSQGNNGSLYMNFGRWSGGYAAWNTADNALALNEWHHVAVTYDYASTANDPILYINGVAVGLTETVAPSGTVNTTNAQLYVGNRASADRPWAGRIDDFRYYNRVLPASEIATLYANTGGGSLPVTGCPNIGDVCDDGSLYGGDMNYGSTTEKIYVTDQNDAGGAQIQWKTSTGANDIATDSTSDGQSNQNQISPLASFPAFQECANLNKHGKDDWYLPAEDELSMLYTNSAAIDANAVGGFSGGKLWSSTEADTAQARSVGFSSGGMADDPKTSNFRVRCIRKSGTTAGGACASPRGVAGEMIYNDDNNIMQYCNGSAWVGIK